MCSGILGLLMPLTTTSASGWSGWTMDLPSRSASSPLTWVWYREYFLYYNLQVDCSNKLEMYEGSDASGGEIGKYCNDNLPGLITSQTRWERNLAPTSSFLSQLGLHQLEQPSNQQVQGHMEESCKYKTSQYCSLLTKTFQLSVVPLWRWSQAERLAVCTATSWLRWDIHREQTFNVLP